MPVRKASTENRLSEQKIHSLSCIKDIIRLPRSQRHTRLYHSLFSKKIPSTGTTTMYIAVINPAFPTDVYMIPNCCRLLAIQRSTPQAIPPMKSVFRSLPSIFLQLPCCLFHLSFPKGQCMEAVPHLNDASHHIKRKRTNIIHADTLCNKCHAPDGRS